jgi:hypothetical protein
LLRSELQLLVSANVRSSLILSALMMEAMHSSEKPVLQEPHGVTSQKTAFFNHRITCDEKVFLLNYSRNSDSIFKSDLYRIFISIN